ncbi:hypothetical protein [Antarcticimicrobium luteum]|uniref:Asp/Glu/hydantoin racemase n=1 Tax=Antarcticimicrobium luteum TaxID=2547397 RepID=A0A4R5UTM4_9RHOB|nr:hypothetical protein [Antarcticimicrobium luteum]TDK42391.1 hypothetical protein E1832_19855 [Antarcticimicrobium luteum]
MTALTLIHTAEVHRGTFDALAARIAPGARLVHVVRPDWLARAQDGIAADLADEIEAEIAAAPGAVLCSCTTLGPVAGAAGAVRIDAPMMALAARTGGPVLLAYCLESTQDASRALLEAAFAAVGTTGEVRMLDLGDLWGLFEAGDTEGFAQEIAGRVEAELRAAPGTGCVVLAQASMAGAAAHIAAGVPVLTSPETALRAALGLT